MNHAGDYAAPEIRVRRIDGRGGNTNAGPSPHHHVRPVPVVLHEEIAVAAAAEIASERRYGNEHCRSGPFRDAGESGRRDADDRAWHAPDFECLAENIPAAEMRLPERVAEDRDVRARGERVL